jgi:ATP-binding cassette subfamily B multidrug efflux pump
LFRLFEKLLHPYPEAEPALPPKGFFQFVWACTRGLRGYIAALSVLSAGISIYEAWLFALLGHIVDWLSHSDPARLWEQQGREIEVLASILIASTLLVAMQTILKHQTLPSTFRCGCAGTSTG